MNSQNDMNELIKEYHRLYAKYKRPEYLEIATNLGESAPDNFKEIWERRVNQGCERTGIEKIYKES